MVILHGSLSMFNTKKEPCRRNPKEGWIKTSPDASNDSGAMVIGNDATSKNGVIRATAR